MESVAAAPGQQEAQRGPETIQVRLELGYFARERRLLASAAANCRQKLSSLRPLDPARNEARKASQEAWNEKEKYTLDSLNAIGRPLDDKFQWRGPDEGRQVWASKLQYLLAITSYSIGLGNVVRFPILVQRNGGLAFVIPFVIMLLVEGIPLFYLELAIGQRMRRAAISCWGLVSPLAAGVGLASAAVSFVVGLYYNTVVAWALLYLWDAARADGRQALPFARCPNRTSAECQAAGPFQYYWFRRTLNASPDVNEWAGPNWPVFGALLAAWLISYLCLVRGLSSSKRVVYVASTLPYVILTVFFLKAVKLDGMSEGIYYLFKPDWSKLAEPYVWLQSAGQVFFSLGLGFGGLIALSSYNQVNNNCYRDAIKVSLINFATSIYAAIVIFAILGYKSQLSLDRCLLERQQMVDYYMSDYKLKALDYGALFNNELPQQAQQQQQQQQQLQLQPPPTLQQFATYTTLPLATTGDIAPGPKSAAQAPQAPQQAPPAQAGSDYYDSSDAIAAIQTIDRQLGQLADEKLDYGDSDAEFVINATALLGSEPELARVAANIPGLPQCSMERELDAAAQGTGLVFVVMIEAISHFKDAQLWALVFLLMLLTLGLDSQFGNLEGLLSSLADLKLATGSLSRPLITGLICAISLLISWLMFAHGAGSYMFAIFDEYAGSFSLVLIALFELIAVSYIYGLGKFCDDCELMTGKRPPFLIVLSWRYISPILLLAVIGATVREFSLSINYEAWLASGQLETKQWPSWCIALGVLLIGACIVWIPLCALLRILLRVSLVPEESIAQCWFPAEELREFHDIQEEHKVTRLERVLFGFRSDDD